jgi:hypothetical protein
MGARGRVAGSQRMTLLMLAKSESAEDIATT